MSRFDQLIEAMSEGRSWQGMGESDDVRRLLSDVYDERYHGAAHFKGRYQVRVNLQKKEDAASYAGWITSENPSSGPYQGTSFVWMPGDGGSVAVLVIGTDGFGADAHILGRPGHARRLRALSRLHRGSVWVKPDLLDLASRVPEAIARNWPAIPAALASYGHVIYAAVPVCSTKDAIAVEDLLDLFFFEHATPITGNAGRRWTNRLSDIASAIFPQTDLARVRALLEERRFVILEGPPGTGKTRLALKIADAIGSSTRIQFHPARTYEDFVVGLFPRPVGSGIAFEVRSGDFLRANAAAAERPHVLVIDEVNRADLARVLGEAIVLLEPGEAREIELPQVPEGHSRSLRLSKHLLVLGTRNTADRTVARIDVAIRRRFAFLEMWPDRASVAAQDDHLAQESFDDVVHTFAEFADDEALRFVPGHAYFLDPGTGPKGRTARIAHRLQFELIPLLRDYVSEKLCGNATEEIAGLADRIESRLLAREA